MAKTIRYLKFTIGIYWCVYDSDVKCNISLMQLGTKKWINHLIFCSPSLILTLAFCPIGVDETAGTNSSSQFDAFESNIF